MNVDDQAGTQRMLTAFFPRVATAIGTGAVSVVLFGVLPVVLPLVSGFTPLEILVGGAVGFGWFVVPLWITALRGGYLALTETGLVINTGTGSVLIPWTAISSVKRDTDGTHARNPVLQVSIRGDRKVPGWPWPIALTPVLFGSSRRKLRILAWWLRPVPLERLVTAMKYLASHPDERSRIGSSDPGELLRALSADTQPPA